MNEKTCATCLFMNNDRNRCNDCVDRNIYTADQKAVIRAHVQKLRDTAQAEADASNECDNFVESIKGNLQAEAYENVLKFIDEVTE